MSNVSELLRATVERLGTTQKRLSDETGLSPKHISALAQDKVGMTGRTAIVLERATGVPASEWLLAYAKDQEESARASMPTQREEAQRYVRRQFGASGFAPEATQLTGRDREVIRLVFEYLGLK